MAEKPYRELSANQVLVQIDTAPAPMVVPDPSAFAVRSGAGDSSARAGQVPASEDGG